MHAALPCEHCVTCACAALPKMDEDGLCASCGGTPLAVVIACHGPGDPHVGVEVEGMLDRLLIRRLIKDATPDDKARWAAMFGGAP